MISSYDLDLEYIQGEQPRSLKRRSCTQAPSRHSIGTYYACRACPKNAPRSMVDCCWCKKLAPDCDQSFASHLIKVHTYWKAYYSKLLQPHCRTMGHIKQLWYHPQIRLACCRNNSCHYQPQRAMNIFVITFKVIFIILRSFNFSSSYLGPGPLLIVWCRKSG